MGVFGGKKKQKDYNILSGNGLVGFVRGRLKKPTEENVLMAVQEIVKPDAVQEHLTKEGTLPWGWYKENKEFTSKIDSEYSHFLNEWVASRSLSPVKQYGALKSFVLYMIDAQKLCYSKGECFAYWFDGVASPEYIEERTAELKELEANFEQLQDLYERRQKELKGLERRVAEILKQNDGILQADFVKLFDASVKNEVAELLYQWSKKGKIERTKSGRSYILHMK